MSSEFQTRHTTRAFFKHLLNRCNVQNTAPENVDGCLQWVVDGLILRVRGDRSPLEHDGEFEFALDGLNHMKSTVYEMLFK